MDTAGIVNLIFSLDEFSPLQPISRGQSGMYERENREEAPLLRLFSVIISTILIKLTIPTGLIVVIRKSSHRSKIAQKEVRNGQKLTT